MTHDWAREQLQDAARPVTAIKEKTVDDEVGPGAWMPRSKG